MFNRFLGETRMSIKKSTLWLAVVAAVSPTLSSAHHAFAAEFDADRPVEVQGVVKRVRFVNPHSWIYIDVTGPDGKVTTWGFEFGSPNSLANAGLSKEDIKPGTKVKINGFRGKSAQPVGYSSVLTLEDGRSVKTGGAGDAPSPAPGARPAGGNP